MSPGWVEGRQGEKKEERGESHHGRRCPDILSPAMLLRGIPAGEQRLQGLPVRGTAVRLYGRGGDRRTECRECQGGCRKGKHFPDAIQAQTRSPHELTAGQGTLATNASSLPIKDEDRGHWQLAPTRGSRIHERDWLQPVSFLR